MQSNLSYRDSKLNRVIKATLLIIALVPISNWANAQTKSRPVQAEEVLVKIAPNLSFFSTTSLFSVINSAGGKIKPLMNSETGNWMLIKVPKNGSHSNLKNAIRTLSTNPNVISIQPNYRIKLYDSDSKVLVKKLKQFNAENPGFPQKPVPPDNPDIPDTPNQQTGADPDYDKQWGMKDNSVKEAWKLFRSNAAMTVAVIDTGVDYTHPDLLPNMWRNPGETGTDSQGRNKEKNGVDDDNNGYVDDVVGWDFVSNDNKPFDLPVDVMQLLMGSGNPGHGTHCAGNVAARADNNIGVVGVAPQAKIMALRFISEKGQGTTADAIKAIKYAVDNGAKVLSNSWGSEGEDPKEGQQNQALRDAITYAESKGTLFIAAAGNGHQGKGYDNDSDPKPAYPASYPHESIISVAALDANNNLGSFSNWGAKTVDIGAPGVAVFSTTVGGEYSDKVVDIPGLITVTWDGTSMATPHVAGAAALYWATFPNKTWREVKDAILRSAKPIPAMSGKSVSNGKLDVLGLMRVQ